MPRKKKSKAKVGGTCKVPKTKKIGNKTFTRMSKTYTKAQAKAAAKRHREGGKNKLARVVANPCGTGFHVFKRG